MIKIEKISIISILFSFYVKNKALRTFFTLILMSNSLEQRLEFEKKFIRDLSDLPEDEQVSLKLEWQNSLKNLLLASKKLHEQVVDFGTNQLPTKQAV